MPLNPGEIHIHDANAHLFVYDPVIGGEQKKRGLVPRNFSTHPLCFSPRSVGFDMPIIDRANWADLINQLESTNSNLSSLRNQGMYGEIIPSRDQNGRGYCWAHSSTSACMLLRARDNEPYADLSAYAVACIIKHYADEGGWGAQSLDWIVENGIPTSQFWPQKSASRSNDNPEMRANAKLHRVAETWMDMSQQEYDRNLTFDQVVTCLLCRIPVVVDFNWWSHSVCAVDVVSTSNAEYRDPDTGKLLDAAYKLAIRDATGGFGLRIWNSWGDDWSDKGMGVLSGNHAHPDGSCAPRTSYPSQV